MSFLRRKSGLAGSTDPMQLLHSIQICCSLSRQRGRVEPNPLDLHQTLTCLEHEVPEEEMHSCIRWMANELQNSKNNEQLLLHLLCTLEFLVCNTTNRSFHMAVIKGPCPILNVLERIIEGDGRQAITRKALHILDTWHRQFQHDPELSFQIEELETDDLAWMDKDLNRFDALLTSLESEFQHIANTAELNNNALAMELIRACELMGPELRSLIELAGGWKELDSLTHLLEMNDRLLRAIAKFQALPEYDPFVEDTNNNEVKKKKKEYTPFDDVAGWNPNNPFL